MPQTRRPDLVGESRAYSQLAKQDSNLAWLQLDGLRLLLCFSACSGYALTCSGLQCEFEEGSEWARPGGCWVGAAARVRPAPP